MSDSADHSKAPRGPRLLPQFDLNPAYGSGAFRRAVELVHAAGAVQATLADNNHAMEVSLRHDGQAIVAISGRFIRWPTTGCPGAVEQLDELVGTPLVLPADALRSGGRARRHCTHLFDLALLALAMAARPRGTRRWDAVVPDAQDGRTVATITLDGDLVHRWPLVDQDITLAGEPSQSLLKGFGAWASERFAGDQLEGAGILRMAAFTARARAHITDNRPVPLRDFPERRGACFAYSPPMVHTALHRIGVVRDLSQGHRQVDP